MKFIEKKCPNCGGDLEFKASDTDVTCKYCQRSFVIEKENNINNKDVFDEETYNLVASTAIGASRGIFVFIGIIIFMIAIVTFIVVANTSSRRSTPRTSNSKTVTVESLGYVIKYSDINIDLINELKTSGINELNNDINFYVDHFMPKIVSRWNYVGSYFLVRKSTDETFSYENNVLYDVYEIVYKIDNQDVSYYGVVKNSNFKNINGEIVALRSASTKLPKNEIGSGKYAFGYISLKSVYNDLVSKELDNYTIETSIDND